jgi:tRNA(fMet)-specific endonuclease VapC
MTVAYLLDTNVLSEPIRPRPSPSVMSRLKAHQNEMALAAPVWHELCFGCRRLPHGRRRQAIQRYLDEVVWPCLPILPYDREAAEWHAAERARLEALGLTPAFVDGQIASIARVNDLVLVTANLEDYRQFEGLQLADWSAAKS